MLSVLIRWLPLLIDVPCVANQVIAPTSLPPCRNRSTVTAGSIESGKWPLSGFSSKATLDRLALASVSSVRPSVSSPGARVSCAWPIASTIPATTAS